MKFQMSLPTEPTFTLSPDGNSMSPLKNMAAPSPAKTHAQKIHEKTGSISNTCARAPLRDDIPTLWATPSKV